jgi:N-acetylmuramoyl-L-alanine amidase
MTEEGRLHRVQQGESTTSLAYENGHFWKTIWFHPRNEELRKLRGHQNILLPGDEVFIPDIEPGEVPAQTDKRHRFVRKGVPEWLNIRFLDLDGDPYANAVYLLIIDGKHTRGNLDGQGWLRAPVPPNARQGRAEIGPSGELAACDLDLGALDPITELTGVQARLWNLGLYDGAVNGETSDELREAIHLFREKTGLPEGDEIDDDFRRKLEATHSV